MSEENEIEFQRQLLNADCGVLVSRPCVVGDGILCIEDFNSKELDLNKLNVSFFVPASGSGSRMFQELNEFRTTKVITDKIQFFLDSLDYFPFGKLIPEDLKKDRSIEGNLKIADFVLDEDGLNYNQLPKGLIPFHRCGEELKTPFEEHACQVELLGIHRIEFSVQNEYIEEIRNKLSVFTDLEVNLSVQDKNTDAYCFDQQGELVIENGVPVRRPAGHGALLSNLNQIDSDYVLVRNIDNIQPISCASTLKSVWLSLLGILVQFNEDLKELESGNCSLQGLVEKYQLGNLNEFTESELLTRPVRVCGVVKNEGAPGGGPFWTEYRDRIRKQIVEKVQITDVSLFENATHFNPVIMALATKDIDGKKYNFSEFVRQNERIKVVKDHKGIKVVYHELPGLWNGSMGEWTTIFVEIPSEVFTPVKEVQDLLNEPHCF